MCHTFVEVCRCCKQFINVEFELKWQEHSQFNFHQDCGRLSKCLTRVYTIDKAKMCPLCSLHRHQSPCNATQVPSVAVITSTLKSVVEVEY